jgi:hypothetical protein
VRRRLDALDVSLPELLDVGDALLELRAELLYLFCAE